MIRVLIVDDNPSFRKQLNRFLQEQRGIEVVGEACEGTDAVAKVKSLKPDIVLMDIRMPWMNGFEVIEIIKKNEMKTKIIVLTSYEYSEYKEKARELGVRSYVVKKSIFETLIPEINSIIAESQNQLNAGEQETADPGATGQNETMGTE